MQDADWHTCSGACGGERGKTAARGGYLGDHKRFPSFISVPFFFVCRSDFIVQIILHSFHLEKYLDSALQKNGENLDGAGSAPLPFGCG